MVSIEPHTDCSLQPVIITGILTGHKLSGIATREPRPPEEFNLSGSYDIVGIMEANINSTSAT